MLTEMGLSIDIAIELGPDLLSGSILFVNNITEGPIICKKDSKTLASHWHCK